MKGRSVYRRQRKRETFFMKMTGFCPLDETVSTQKILNVKECNCHELSKSTVKNVPFYRSRVFRYRGEVLHKKNLFYFIYILSHLCSDTTSVSNKQNQIFAYY